MSVPAVKVESPGRSLAVAAAIAFGCSVMVASAVHFLRPLAPVEAFPARARAVLEAAGRLPAGTAGSGDLAAAYHALDARVVDLATGEFAGSDDPHGFDHWETAAAADTIGSPRAPVYFVRDSGRLERIVLPVHGPGMWSTIYGYLALAPDLSTVADLVIFRHGETPGVGDRIEEESWQAGWRGKKVFGDDGEAHIDVVAEARTEYEVDLVTGASVTCEAVGDIVRESFGPDGYGPFIERLRQE